MKTLLCAIAIYYLKLEWWWWLIFIIALAIDIFDVGTTQINNANSINNLVRLNDQIEKLNEKVETLSKNNSK